MITVTKIYIVKYDKKDEKTGEIRNVQENFHKQEKALQRRAELEEKGVECSVWRFETIDAHEMITSERPI